jgi:hypothetical protein
LSEFFIALPWGITRPFEIIVADEEKTSSNSTKVVEKNRMPAYNAGILYVRM